MAGTGWEAATSTFPTNLPPGGSANIELDILNTGARPSSGSITVTDVLPTGVTATAAGGMPDGGPTIFSAEEEEIEFGGARWKCSGTNVVTCTSNPEFLPSLPIGAGNEASIAERIGIAVDVQAGVSGTFANRITVAGGGASSVTSVNDPVTMSSSEPGFGFSRWDAWFTNADGTPDTQAGSHPYEATFFLGLNERKASWRAEKPGISKLTCLRACLASGSNAAVHPHPAGRSSMPAGQLDRLGPGTWAGYTTSSCSV